MFYKPYTTKTGAQQFKPSFAWIAANADEFNGFCLACANEQEGCEPDARRYVCDACGAAKVYGAQELALMGLCY